MERRTYALRVLRARELAGKLEAPPVGLTDREPGRALRLSRPGRPRALRPVKRPPRVPALGGMHDPAQRARILHAFANHELQAVELFAWALLAFPEAPADFRRELLGPLAEEQQHLALYCAALERLGQPFGSLPVNAYFWSKLPLFDTPRQFVSGVCLVFENANLDHSLDYAEAARAAGDEDTAQLLERVHRDEVRHVAFGLRWLRAFAEPGADLYSAWRASLRWPLRPSLARGRRFRPEARAGSGLDVDFLERLAHDDDAEPER
ncbi:MAG: hypothetical protein DHS20C15_15560 [Planctomycetota bacterium]|nr:MAG: hypothetical protein DHS20C15_15560 [Planctomycetota bacterium]